MNPTAAAPVADAQRHDVLDALLGLALSGVLLVKLRDFSLYSLLPEAGRAAYAAFYAPDLGTALAANIDYDLRMRIANAPSSPRSRCSRCRSGSAAGGCSVSASARRNGSGAA